MSATAQRKPILVATKGHPFDKAAFFAMFDAMRGLTWTHVEQPAAMHLFRPEIAAEFGCFVLYDLPGLRFRRGGVDIVDAPASFRRDFEALLDQGFPFVVLHHALAGWPSYDRYAEAFGARFFYKGGPYKGIEHPDSGYGSPQSYRVGVVAEHPVTAGLGDGFELTDELYLFDLLEPDVVPLLRARASFTDTAFHSAAAAVEGRTAEGWSHPPGTDLIAWARRVGKSPVVVIQPGDRAETFADAHYRLLLRNAIDWVRSDAAADWASEHD